MKFDLGHINKLIAVSVELGAEVPHFHYQELKLKKGEIVFGKSAQKFTEIVDLVKKMGKTTPLVLHFSGKGILNRSVAKTADYRHSLLLNTNLNQFYFSDFLATQNVYSSIIRKDLVLPIVEEFKQAGVEVVSFASGPFIAAPLKSVIKKSFIDINNTRLQFSDDLITHFTNDDNYRTATELGGDLIDHKQIGAIALATNFFQSIEGIVIPEEELVSEVYFNEAKQKNIFHRFGAAMVIFFFSILVGNYLYLNYLNSKIENNYGELAGFEDQLGEITFLQEEADRKQKLLNSSGLLNRKFLSYYLMEISNTVPDDIALSMMSVRPIEKEIKKRHKIEFLSQTIWIRGESKSSDLLSRWIEDLTENEWINKVDILDYSYVKNVGEFELELMIL